MQPHVRVSVITGVVGLVINIFVSAIFGFCGPAVAMIVGGVAGYLGLGRKPVQTKSAGASLGATSGAIAAGLTLIGQLIGAMISLILVQSLGLPTIFGEVPELAGQAGASAIYYVSGLVAATCFGLVGIMLGVGTGAAVGYIATSEEASPDFQDVTRIRAAVDSQFFLGLLKRVCGNKFP